MKGYIFTCTNKTEKECFDLMIFGTNKLYGDNVLEIERGDILYGLDFNKIKYSKPQIIDEKPILEATTLWDYPKQSYGKNPKGNNKYAGATSAFIIYNYDKTIYRARGSCCGSYGRKRNHTRCMPKRETQVHYIKKICESF